MSLRERLYRFRSFWIFPLLGAGILYVTFTADADRGWADLLWMLPLGFLLWSLLEYGLHRFIFHVDVANPAFREIINASHISHHQAPRDPDRLFVKPSYGMIISSMLYGLLYLVFWSPAPVTGVLVGIWAGFLYYESVHYRVHITASGSGLIGRQRRAHFYHHFINPTRCFGVTSPFWDHVFRTAQPPRRQSASQLQSQA